MGRQPAENKDFRENLLKTLVACKDSPSLFAQKILQYEPYWYNSEYLECKDKWVVYRTGRKCGKTYSAAAKALHFAWFAPFMLSTVHDVCEIIMVAPTQNQASIILSMIKTLAMRSRILEDYIVRDVAGELWIKFINGGGVTKIYTRASGDKGTSIRGYVPHVIILDEAAFVRRAVVAALIPAGLATNARIWLTSTPFAQNGYFYEACMDAKAGSKILKGTTWDRPSGRWTQFHANTLMNPEVKKNPDIADEMKKMSRDSYKIDVLGQFLEVGNALIPRELIMRAVGDYTMPKYVRHYLGVDIARTGKDETVYTLVAVDEHRNAYVVSTQARESSLLTEIVDDIRGYVKSYGQSLEMVYCDETGVGAGVVDMAMVAGLPVQGVVFSLQEKERMYNTLVMLFENERIKLGSSQGELVNQLAFLQKQYTADSHMRVISEIHDDMTDSLALACKPLEEGDRWRVLDVSGIDTFA